MNRVKPRVHVFGHNHDQFGSCHFRSSDNMDLVQKIQQFYGEPPNEDKFDILYVNAAQALIMKPLVFDYYY